MIDQDLLTYLQLLNTAAGTRIYFGSAEQEDLLPIVVLRRTGGAHPRTTGGRKLFERSNFEVNVLAHTHAQSYPISTEITEALHDFRGVIGGTRIVNAQCVQFPDHVTEVEGDNRKRWVTSQFRFMHHEEV